MEQRNCKKYSKVGTKRESRERGDLKTLSKVFLMNSALIEIFYEARRPLRGLKKSAFSLKTTYYVSIYGMLFFHSTRVQQSYAVVLFHYRACVIVYYFIQVCF